MVDFDCGVITAGIAGASSLGHCSEQACVVQVALSPPQLHAHYVSNSNAK